ncbi:MAG TPA: ATP-binding protein [Anaeromyxobacter sp.]|nr:ATP-binding protein [Anaeromyxobacter sp.]
MFRVQIAAPGEGAGPKRESVAPARRPPTAREDRRRHNLTWLVHLHWWAIAGQAVLIGAAQAFTRLGLPLGTLALVLAGEALLNLGLWSVSRRAHATDAVIGAVMVADALVLTAVLDLTGGAANPFSTLYLVNVALAAVLLPPRWSWLVLGVSLGGFAGLFAHERAFGAGHHLHPDMGLDELIRTHLAGMWLALALASVFVVFFVQRLTYVLAVRERELRETRTRAVQREKLAALATLAAGAAHELSTPLSTIAIVAKELQRSLKDSVTPEVRGDLQLVRDQIARCREILDRMSAQSGANMGEPFVSIGVQQWIEQALSALVARDRVRVEVVPPAGEAAIFGPPKALAETLRGLMKNAVQASPAGAEVVLRTAIAEGRVLATVIDRGKGMAPDVLARVGEPFFTTKVPGEGMGLGLFLTRALAEQLGGELRITSSPGMGTEATIDLPATQAGERSAE